MSVNQQLPGKILLIGPSRAGKSFLGAAFRAKGLHVVDADKETDLIKWRDDATGEPVTHKPSPPTDQWLATHHFLIDKRALVDYLAGEQDVIMLAHCWNILDCIDLFDASYLMYVSPDELARRMKLHRPDHKWQGSKAEVDFMLARHTQRHTQARELGIPFLDVTGDSDDILARLIALREQDQSN